MIMARQGNKRTKIRASELEQNNENNEKNKTFLLPKDEADTKNAIIEIRNGTGGLEASLFASDLFRCMKGKQ